MIFGKRGLMKLVAIQSLINGLWLITHNGKQNYTTRIQGFQHMGFLNSWAFCLLAIGLGVALLFAAWKNIPTLQIWLLVILNGTWSFYTIVLLINEINGVPNMSWALFLGYNILIYMSARYEVISK